MTETEIKKMSKANLEPGTAPQKIWCPVRVRARLRVRAPRETRRLSVRAPRETRQPLLTPAVVAFPEPDSLTSGPVRISVGPELGPGAEPVGLKFASLI